MGEENVSVNQKILIFPSRGSMHGFTIVVLVYYLGWGLQTGCLWARSVR